MKQQKHNRNWTCQHSNVKSQSCFATKNMNFKLNIKNNTIVSNFTSSRFRLSKVKNSTTPKSSLLFVSKKSNMLNVHYTLIFFEMHNSKNKPTFRIDNIPNFRVIFFKMSYMYVSLKFQILNVHNFKCSQFQNFKLHGPTSSFEYQNT